MSEHQLRASPSGGLPLYLLVLMTIMVMLFQIAACTWPTAARRPNRPKTDYQSIGGIAGWRRVIAV